ncbi:hypothetical protein C8R47DRAFT_719794 [Mycena vitilis]|nr:hypothetical protein C8R47DRAFT_719794 [Mycena vitilis]
MPSLPAAQQLATLPAFHFIADPIRIPSAAQFDGLSIPAQNTVARARTSLRAVGDLSNMPSSAFPNLWLNLWPWYLFFFQSYGDELPDPEYTEERGALHRLSAFHFKISRLDRFIQSHGRDAGLSHDAHSVLGVRSVLRRPGVRDAILNGYNLLALFLFPSMKTKILHSIQDLLPEGRNAAVPEHRVELLDLLLTVISDTEETATRYLIRPTGVRARFQLFMSPADIGVLSRMVYALAQPTPWGYPALDSCLTSHVCRPGRLRPSLATLLDDPPRQNPPLHARILPQHGHCTHRDL